MFGTSILISVISLFISLFSFLNQLVLAWLFGTSAAMEIYLVAISMPMFISGILSVGLSYSLVPALMAHRSEADDYRRFAGLLMISFIAVAALISIFGYWVAPLQIAILGHAISLTSIPEAVAISRITWVTTAAILLVGQLRAMHNVQQRFVLASLSSLAPPMFMTIAGLVFAKEAGPISIAWGTLAGHLVVIGVLIFSTLEELTFSKEIFSFTNKVTKFISTAPLVGLAMLSFTIFQPSDAYWAPKIGPGHIADLGYCQRILVAISGAFTFGPTSVLLPLLAKAHIDGRTHEICRQTLRGMKIAASVAVPFVLAVIVLAEPIVRIIFKRGAFNQQATAGVSTALAIMMLGMIPLICVIIIFRTLFATHKFYSTAALGCITAIAYFTLSGLFINASIGNGIAIAYVLTWYLLLPISASFLWHKNLRQIINIHNALFIVKICASSSLCFFLLRIEQKFAENYYSEGPFLFLHIITIIIISTSTYFYVSINILKIEELILLRGKWKQVLKYLEKYLRKS